VSGTGPVFLLPDTGKTGGVLAARYRLAKYHPKSPSMSSPWRKTNSREGSWILPHRDAGRTVKRRKDLGLDFGAFQLQDVPPATWERAPRLGGLGSWADTIDRRVPILIDQPQIPYTYLRDEDIRAGRHCAITSYVLLYGHVDSKLASKIQAFPKLGAIALQSTPQDASFGRPAESDTHPGGVSVEGLATIQRFVEDRGLLVTLGSGSMLPLEAGMRVEFDDLRRGCPPPARQWWRLRLGRGAQQEPQTPARMCASPSTVRLAWPTDASSPHSWSSARIFPLYDIHADGGCAGLLHHLP